jgi:hypothetical protein
MEQIFMFGLEQEDEIAVLDPVVAVPEDFMVLLQDINGAVLKEVLMERIKNGITKRQLELLTSVLLISDN